MKKLDEFRKQQSKIAQESWEKMMLGLQLESAGRKDDKNNGRTRLERADENVSKLTTIGVR